MVWCCSSLQIAENSHIEELLDIISSKTELLQAWREFCLLLHHTFLTWTEAKLSPTKNNSLSEAVFSAFKQFHPELAILHRGQIEVVLYDSMYYAKAIPVQREKNLESIRKQREANLAAFQQVTQQRTSPENSTAKNYLIPINKVLADQTASLAGLDVSRKHAGLIKRSFGWCADFSASFFSGAHKLGAWFEQHGIRVSPSGEALETYTEHAKVSFVARSCLDSAFHSLSSATSSDPAEVAPTAYVNESDGVKQIWLTFPAEQAKSDQCVALLMKVPTGGLQTQSERLTSSHERVVNSAHSTRCLEAKLPAAVVTGEGIKIIGDPVPVEYQWLVLTLPRVHFLLACALSCESHTCGVQLDGVHGAGKSTILRALVAILCAGSDTDSCFIPNAWAHVDAGCPVELFKSSTGRLSKHSEQLSSLTWPLSRWVACMVRDDSQDAFMRPRATDRLLLPELDPFPEGRAIVVLDEVNQLLKQRKVSAHEYLKWYRFSVPGVLRIQAASPDGVREELTDKGSAIRFELRPAPAWHMAAILSVAPECMVNGLVVDGSLALSPLKRICEKFACNMRILTQLLGAASPAAGAAADLGAVSPNSHVKASDLIADMQSDQTGVYDAYIKTLSQRMQKTLSFKSDEGQWLLSAKDIASGYYMNTGRWIQQQLRNASLLVRESAMYPSSPTHLVGTVAYDAQANALNDVLASGAEMQRALFSSSSTNDDSRDIFEFKVAWRLYLRVLCRRVVLISELDDVKTICALGRTPGRAVARSVKDTPLDGITWHSSQHSDTGQRAWLVKCPRPQFVGRDVLQALEACKVHSEGGVVVIQTASNGPYADFIVFRCVGNLRAVVFVESTTGPLAKHSSSKTLPGDAKPGKRFRESSGAAVDDEMVPKVARSNVGGTPASSMHGRTRSASVQEAFKACPPGLRDIVLLLGHPKYVVKTEAAGMRFQAAYQDAAAQSVANAWLTVLDAPFRFRMATTGASNQKRGKQKAASRSPKSKTLYTFTKKALPGCEEESESWQAAVLYVSRERLDMQPTTAYQQLKCDFAYCAYGQLLDH